MFSFLDKPFRTGASAAARDAKASGEEALGMQKDWMAELKGLLSPGIEMGQQATQQLSDYYMGGPEAQQSVYDTALASPAFERMQGVGEEAAMRAAASTGNFRGGALKPALAQNSQNILQGLVDKNLQGMGALSDYGMNAQRTYTGGGANALNQITGTMGNIANIDVNQAAGRQNMLTGLVQGATSAFTPYALNKWG